MRQSVLEDRTGTSGKDAVSCDAVLCDDVGSALRATGRVDLQHVEISAQSGEVCLKGRVPTYYLKQLAQATTQQVAGVRTVENAVEVY